MKEHQVDVSVSITPVSASQAPNAAQTEELLRQARAAAARAYAPYSRFRVGAAALLDNGQIVSGCNQENAAYPSGLCAERVTVFYANSRYPEAKVLRLLICAETDNGPVISPITPCGACRQSLLEKETAQGLPIFITLAGVNELYHLPKGIASLLPLTFVKDSLEGK